MPCTVVDVQDAATNRTATDPAAVKLITLLGVGWGWVTVVVVYYTQPGTASLIRWDWSRALKEIKMDPCANLGEEHSGSMFRALGPAGWRGLDEQESCKCGGAGRSPRAPKTTVKSWLCILSERGSQKRGPGKAVTWFTLTFCDDRNVPHLHCPYGRC